MMLSFSSSNHGDDASRQKSESGGSAGAGQSGSSSFPSSASGSSSPTGRDKKSNETCTGAVQIGDVATVQPKTTARPTEEQQQYCTSVSVPTSNSCHKDFEQQPSPFIAVCGETNHQPAANVAVDEISDEFGQLYNTPAAESNHNETADVRPTVGSIPMKFDWSDESDTDSNSEASCSDGVHISDNLGNQTHHIHVVPTEASNSNQATITRPRPEEITRVQVSSSPPLHVHYNFITICTLAPYWGKRE